VPDGTSRLRFTVMSSHRGEELAAAARTIGGAARELGLKAAHPAPAPVA
jgi:hypothetical protein